MSVGSKAVLLLNSERVAKVKVYMTACMLTYRRFLFDSLPAVGQLIICHFRMSITSAPSFANGKHFCEDQIDWQCLVIYNVEYAEGCGVCSYLRVGVFGIF